MLYMIYLPGTRAGSIKRIKVPLPASKILPVPLTVKAGSLVEAGSKNTPRSVA